MAAYYKQIIFKQLTKIKLFQRIFNNYERRTELLCEPLGEIQHRHLIPAVGVRPQYVG